MSDFSKIPNLTLGTDPRPYRKRIADLKRELAEARKDVERLREKLQEIRDWPPKDYPRRDADGYPKEYMYDEFAYRRMIDSYRHAIDNAMKGQDA